MVYDCLQVHFSLFRKILKVPTTPIDKDYPIYIDSFSKEKLFETFNGSQKDTKKQAPTGQKKPTESEEPKITDEQLGTKP